MKQTDPLLVLVVEDNDELRDQIIEIINQTVFYQAIGATNGADALVTINDHKRWFGFKENAIKCVILDINMPIMNGLEFLKELRKQENHLFKTSIPVIFLSAYEDSEKWNEVIHHRVIEYLKKPFEDSTLLSLMDRVIRNQEAGEISHNTRSKAFDKRREFYHKEQMNQL